jgi:hypothetical protein
LGFCLVSLAVLIFTGVDKNLETWVLQHSPSWLTTLTTRI